MALKGYQRGELIGVILVLAATAAQIFYLEPLKREIEWRLAAFNMQQSGQIQVSSIFDSRIAVLEAVNAPAEKVEQAKAEREKVIAQYKTADANVSDYLVEKERVEGLIQLVVIALFAIGTLLTAFGRAMEMRAAQK